MFINRLYRKIELNLQQWGNVINYRIISCRLEVLSTFVTFSVTTPDADFSLIDWKGRSVGVGVRGLLIVNEGTVCNDNFSNNSANAICRRMGYSGQISWTSGDRWKIQDDRPIAMDNVSCNSGEWSSCPTHGLTTVIIVKMYFFSARELVS